MAERPDNSDFGTPFYLPDFCAPRMVFAIVLIAELVALTLSLAKSSALQIFWIELAKSSLFLLWIGLLSAAVLCFARPRLAKTTVARASVISLLLLLITTAVVSEAAFWVGQYWIDRIGDVESTLFPPNRFLFLAQNLLIGGIVSSLALRYFYVSNEWKRNVQMEAQARISALQARIRPHFLFNSMNTIASLTRTDPSRAEEAIEDLADLFRATLGDSKSHLRLKEELELARIYQRIEQLRLGDRLNVKWDVQDLPMRALIPGLTIQPLLENAIYHGVEPLPEGGTITVSGKKREGEIEIRVTNPVPENNDHTREGNRHALANIRQRFEIAYQGKASVTVEDETRQFQVTIVFPLRERPV